MLAQRECIVELTGVAEVQGTRSSVRAGTRGEEGECVGCGEDHVLEEEDPIETVGGVRDGGVFEGTRLRSRARYGILLGSHFPSAGL